MGVLVGADKETIEVQVSPLSVYVDEENNTVEVQESAVETVEIDITKQYVEIREGVHYAPAGYGWVLLDGLELGKILLSKAVGDLDNIANGIYGKVLAADITDGHLTFGAIVGTLNDIADGEGVGAYGKVLLTDISAGHIVLAECEGDLNDIADGSGGGVNYGKVKLTDISAGHILLAECDKTSYTLNNVDDGSGEGAYGKVLLTDISSGHIVLATCEGDLGDIADGVGEGAYGKVLVTYITAGAINLATNIVSQGNLATQNSVAWASQLTGIPSTLGTPSGSGLFLSTAYMGFYTGGVWKTYIASNGYFYFAGADANHYIKWDGSNFQVKGLVSAQALSALSADLGTITAGTITLNASGFIRGGQTDYKTGTGFFLGYSGGAYKFSIGDATHYMAWNGTGLEVRGAKIPDVAAGTEPSILGWVTTCVFSATDYRTVAWAEGTIKLTEGTTYNIVAGNTGSMSAVTYIYLDKTVESGTVLQKTTTAINSVGAGKILVCVAQQNSDDEKDALFQAFGTNNQSILITADVIAANTITGNEIAVNSVNANVIEAGTIIGDYISASAVIVAGEDNNIGVLDGADATYRIYAGHATPASAPFRVTQAGAVSCSNITITGGSLNINDVFTVSAAGATVCSNLTITGGSLNINDACTISAAGVLVATGADITGAITATSGDLGSLNISGTLAMGAAAEILYQSGGYDYIKIIRDGIRCRQISMGSTSAFGTGLGVHGAPYQPVTNWGYRLQFKDASNTEVGYLDIDPDGNTLSLVGTGANKLGLGSNSGVDTLGGWVFDKGPASWEGIGDEAISLVAKYGRLEHNNATDGGLLDIVSRHATYGTIYLRALGTFGTGDRGKVKIYARLHCTESLYLDSGKVMYMDGVTGNVRMFYNAGAGTIDFYINGNKVGHIDEATGFVND